MTDCLMKDRVVQGTKDKAARVQMFREKAVVGMFVAIVGRLKII